MLQNGLPCNKDITLNGVIHRYCKDGTSKHDEWYTGQIFGDKFYCTYGSYTESTKYRYNSWGDNTVLSEEEKRSMEELQEKAQIEILEQHKKSAEEAKKIWEAADICVNHPYLEKKQAKSYGLKISDGMLIIPLYDFNENLTSIQKINPVGKKRFLPGSKTKGCYFVIGSLQGSASAYFCEGYATGATIHQMTGIPVIVCFSAGQIIPIAIGLRDKYPLVNFYLAAELGDAGKKVSNDWQSIMDGSIFTPSFPEKLIAEGKTDFNDVFVCLGEKEAKKQLALKAYSGIDLSDFLKQEIPPLEFIIENLIIKNSLNFFYGFQGCGKSRLMYSMAYCMATGLPFLKYNILKPMSVLYIDSEMDTGEIQNYWKWIIRNYPKPKAIEKITVLHNEMIRKECNEYINLWSPESRERLNQLFEKHDFIILDNFFTMTVNPGIDGYENREESFKPLDPWFKQWCAQGKTFIMVDHANKTGDLIGTSAKKRSPKTIIRCAPVHEENPVNLKTLITIEKGRHIPITEKASFVAEWKPVQGENPWKITYDIKSKSKNGF